MNSTNFLHNNRSELIPIHHVGLSHDALVETFNRLDRIVRNVATETGAILIGASGPFSGKAWAFDDHVHVVPKGSEALAKFVVERLQNVFSEELRNTGSMKTHNSDFH